MVATCHKWRLNTWNVASSTEGLIFKCYFIEFKLNNSLWLAATVLNNAGLTYDHGDCGWVWWRKKSIEVRRSRNRGTRKMDESSMWSLKIPRMMAGQAMEKKSHKTRFFDFQWMSLTIRTEDDCNKKGYWVVQSEGLAYLGMRKEEWSGSGEKEQKGHLGSPPMGGGKWREKTTTTWEAIGESVASGKCQFSDTARRRRTCPKKVREYWKFC